MLRVTDAKLGIQEIRTNNNNNTKTMKAKATTQ
jgi:hypothetical protein